MSTALTVQPQQTTAMASGNPFEPSSIPEALTLCDMLAKSALVPAAVRNKPADIFIILATARELGIGPMQGLSDINVIQGKPVFSADLMLAKCKQHPEVCQYIRLVESTDQVATYETQRVGSPAPERYSFSMDDARRLGLAGKDNYQKQPKTMLRRRAAAMLARETYQDLVRGYDPDEEEDFARPQAVKPEAKPAESVKTEPLKEKLKAKVQEQHQPEDPPPLDEPAPEPEKAAEPAPAGAATSGPDISHDALVAWFKEHPEAKQKEAIQVHSVSFKRATLAMNEARRG